MAKLKIETTVVATLDKMFGKHLISLLRTPPGPITIAISGPAFRDYGLAEEDWRALTDSGYDIVTRTFNSEDQLKRYLKEYS